MMKDTSGMHFERNEENPLDADAIIIDEMSMVDIYLMHALLRAVNPGTRLILVGIPTSFRVLALAMCCVT